MKRAASLCLLRLLVLVVGLKLFVVSATTDLLDDCDDSISEKFFVASTGRDEPCIWLAARPEEQVIFCDPTNPSGAYDICEETCGKCSDTCEDDEETEFEVDGIIRNCAWLSIRTFRWEELCVPGSSAFSACLDTCNNCGNSTETPDEDDAEPDLAISIPFPTNASGVAAINLDSFQVFVQPSYAEVNISGSEILYIPEWSGIEYDAFALEGKTAHGDTFILSFEYIGSNQTIDVSVDFIGQWFDYIWSGEDEVEEDDEGGNRRLAGGEQRPRLPIEWHHEIPQGPFVTGKNPYNIPGIDSQFINRPENGVILRRGDHSSRGAPISSAAYNRLWTDWVDSFQETNGRLPTRDEILNDALPDIRSNPDVAEMNSRGIRNHGLTYNQWNNPKNRQYKEQVLNDLERQAKQRSVRKTTSKIRSASKFVGKAARALPLIGDVISVFDFFTDVFVDGRPFWEAALDRGQDAIPVWGELRGLYGLGQDLGLFETNLDNDGLEDLVWDFLKGLFGFGDNNDDDDDTDEDDDSKTSGGTSDPHFRGWNGRFSYQGACDLIFVENDMVKIYIRTKFADSRRRFSFISNVAIAVGEDTVEVFNNKTYLVNGATVSGPPSTVGGYDFTASTSKVQIDFAGGQMVKVTFYRGTITLAVAGRSSDFGSSIGFAGPFDRRSLLGRDGITEFNRSTLQQFAQDWSVNPGSGDADLFVESPSNRTCQPASSFTSSQSDVSRAAVECRALADETTRQNCIFDILASGEVEWAMNPGFTDPLRFTPSPTMAPTTTPIPSQAPSPFPSLTSEDLNQVITCIAVIDENEGGPSQLTTINEWDEFRARYPLRPFCLLKPETAATLYIPPKFTEDNNTIFMEVSRDFGDESILSDWFEICNLSGQRSQGIVNVVTFIDNSGSLVTSHVSASYNLLLQRMSEEGLNEVAGIANTAENYIRPFLTDFL